MTHKRKKLTWITQTITTFYSSFDGGSWASNQGKEKGEKHLKIYRPYWPTNICFFTLSSPCMCYNFFIVCLQVYPFIHYKKEYKIWDDYGDLVIKIFDIFKTCQIMVWCYMLLESQSQFHKLHKFFDPFEFLMMAVKKLLSTKRIKFKKWLENFTSSLNMESNWGKFLKFVQLYLCYFLSQYLCEFVGRWCTFILKDNVSKAFAQKKKDKKKDVGKLLSTSGTWAKWR